MPRHHRQLVPGALHHAGHHVNTGRRLFTTGRDREQFLRLFAEAAGAWRIHVISWCLMNSHYHVIVEDPLAQLSAAMHQVNSAYARWCNRRDRERGVVLWQRFFSVPIESDRHLLAALRYVPLNPVAARLSRRPEQWRWSSHPTAVSGRPDPLVEPERLLRWFDGSIDDYRAWVGHTVDDGRFLPPSRLPDPVIMEARPPLVDLAATLEPRAAAKYARAWQYRLREIAAVLDVSVATVHRWTT